jgi:SPP1 gp7 family putative phage head morphogenesis protein
MGLWNAARDRMRAAVVRLNETAPKPRADFSLDFDEAIGWHRARLKPSDAEWANTQAKSKRRAFTVANTAQLDLVNDVNAAINKALKNGTTLRDFKKEVGERLEKAWNGTVANPGARIETIFRTNVQLAYGAGRWQQATQPEVVKERPFWLYDAIEDGRTSAICKACDGTVRRSDDPWWRSHIPPLHHRCRSCFRALTEAEALKRGLTKTTPTTPAAKGFGGEPNAKEWTPDLSDAAPALVAVHHEKEAGANATQKPPEPQHPPQVEPAKPAEPPQKPPAAPPPGDGGGDGNEGLPPIKWHPTPPPDARTPPSWWMEDKEPSTVEVPRSVRLEPHERKTSEYLALRGNKVRFLPVSIENRRKNPDLEINPGEVEGISPIVEITAIVVPRATSSTVKNRIRDKARQGQARALVIDVRDTTLTEKDAIAGVADAVSETTVVPGKYDYVRIIGRGFDLTFWDLG